MRKRIWVLLSLIIIGAIAVGGCTTDNRSPDNTTPEQTRTVPGPNRVTPPNTPTPGTTRTTPDNNRVVPRTTIPGPTNDPGTPTRPDTKQGMDDKRTNQNTANTVANRAESIANAVAKEKNIESASCVITGNTALVGLQFDKQYKGEITDAIKNSVKKRVKKVDDRINEVVVTADPDLLSRIKTMASDIEKGKPLSGFTNEIEEIIRRINPF